MRLSRCGLLGDIHTESGRLAHAIDLFRAISPALDAILFVGDVVDGEGELEECVRLLRDANAIGVRGNHERWLLGGTMRDLPHAHRAEHLAPSTVDFFRALPSTRRFETPLGAAMLCHGVDDEDMQRLRPGDDEWEIRQNLPFERLRRRGDVSLMMGGHTHERMVRDFGDLVVVNAGTLARECADAGCAIVDFDRARATFHRFVDERLHEDGSYPIASGRSFVMPERG
ncbi:hypothetical protein BH09MYX1_BH09MYX1_54470 [soil metagenome]